MKNLITDVQEWAEEKGIYEKSTWESQWLGMIAEVGEVADAIMRNDLDKAEMELGDVIVYYINYLTMRGEDTCVCSELCSFLDDEPYSDIVIVMTTVLELIASSREIIAINTLCNHLQTTTEKALARAVEKITKRSGKMIGGKFVKDSER